jgi:hypothetical protein
MSSYRSNKYHSLVLDLPVRQDKPVRLVVEIVSSVVEPVENLKRRGWVVLRFPGEPPTIFGAWKVQLLGSNLVLGAAANNNN